MTTPEKTGNARLTGDSFARALLDTLMTDAPRLTDAEAGQVFACTFQMLLDAAIADRTDAGAGEILEAFCVVIGPALRHWALIRAASSVDVEAIVFPVGIAAMVEGIKGDLMQLVGNLAHDSAPDAGDAILTDFAGTWVAMLFDACMVAAEIGASATGAKGDGERVH